ncbi:MAG: hypothetical protein HY738_00885 [Bacteroidia bacterium]|nr:hypothetical protein [Bacteroidia bacterium]
MKFIIIFILKKGIGLTESKWIMNLKIKYHNSADKLIQLFYLSDNSDKIDGYNIFLYPLKINNEIWSKIIEGGVNPILSRKAANTFLCMYKYLLAWEPQLNFIGETGNNYHSVMKLLLKSGFKMKSNIQCINEVLLIFFNSMDFKLIQNNKGIEIIRSIAINSNYHGYLLIKNGVSFNNNV